MDTFTVPGGRWTIDTEGSHVVDSVSRICGHRSTMNTEMYSYVRLNLYFQILITMVTICVKY